MTHDVRRALIGAGAIVAALAAGAMPAAADPPDITRYPDFGMEVQWPNDDPEDPWMGLERCDFPVHYQDEGKGAKITFQDRVLWTAPGLHATITNMDSGESLSLPVNGSLVVTEVEAANGHTVVTETFRGPTVYIDPGQLSWFTGRQVVVTEYDESGEVVSGPVVSQRGRVLDVCALLED